MTLIMTLMVTLMVTLTLIMTLMVTLMVTLTLERAARPRLLTEGLRVGHACITDWRACQRTRT